jgi:hypothetical protein
MGLERRYTDQQRDAMAAAYVDLGIRPASRVAELAQAGELELHGEKVEPFTTFEATVRTEAKRLRNRRAGKVRSEMAKLPAQDAIEAMRRRLVTAWEQEMSCLERRKPGNRDTEQIAKLARVAREIRAIPAPNKRIEPEPRRTEQGPASRTPHTQRAGSLIQAARRQAGIEERPGSREGAPSGGLPPAA